MELVIAEKLNVKVFKMCGQQTLSEREEKMVEIKIAKVMTVTNPIRR